VMKAFAASGWDPADRITLLSSVEIGLSVALDRPDLDAPVSPLFFDGRKQDLAFEKPVGRSADERHHIRLWQTATVGADGQPLWLGSASFDRGVGVSHDTGQITHHIGPDLDA
ncbi:LssY C-terminal domain-containing protein, partial [Rhizobium ruizarguesonis]